LSLLVLCGENLSLGLTQAEEKVKKMLSKRMLFSLTMAMLLSLAAFSVGAQEKGKEETQGKKAEGTQAKKSEVPEEQKGNPSGEVTITVTQAAVGLGVSWGDGSLHFKGKNYKFKVKGLSLIGLGVTSINAKGEVYNLQKLDDFPGTYYGVEAGATMIKGSSGMVLKNSSGVVLNLKSERTGAAFRIGNEGLSISPAWE
jgi:hypothetical protein